MGGGPLDFSVRSSPLGTNLGFELGWTALGLGLGVFVNKGLGPGLDNTLFHFNLEKGILGGTFQFVYSTISSIPY